MEIYLNLCIFLGFNKINDGNNIKDNFYFKEFILEILQIFNFQF